MNCIMTALQLNAEMYRELSVIAEDESLIKILNDGDKEIEEGKFEPISLDNLWK